MSILIIEDDKEIADFISKGLQDQGYETAISLTGSEGLELVKKNKYDLLILDRMLPGIDGIEIIKQIRKLENNVPVLILSALGETDDRVTGLTAGGDDYLTKPFALAELIARIESLMRRNNAAASALTELKAHDLSLNLLTRKATRADTEIELNGKEFDLLEYLLRNKGQVVTRTMILENVWNYHFDPQTNIIDVHVSRLRQKLGNISGKPFIRTVRGAGYMINIDI